jgi:hypothetical protein
MRERIGGKGWVEELRFELVAAYLVLELVVPEHDGRCERLSRAGLEDPAGQRPCAGVGSPCVFGTTKAAEDAGAHLLIQRDCVLDGLGRFRFAQHAERCFATAGAEVGAGESTAPPACTPVASHGLLAEADHGIPVIDGIRARDQCEGDEAGRARVAGRGEMAQQSGALAAVALAIALFELRQREVHSEECVVGSQSGGLPQQFYRAATFAGAARGLGKGYPRHAVVGREPGDLGELR